MVKKANMNDTKKGSLKVSNKKSNTKIKKNENKIIEKNELTRLLQIIIIVTAILLIFYFITYLVKKNTKTAKKTDDTVAVIQYDKIMVGQILNKGESEYYVLVEKKNNQYNSLYESYLSTYSSKDNSLKHYTVDLSDVFNRNSISDKTIVEGNDTSSYKFSDSTLIKVKDSSIQSVYTDEESITEVLKALAE